MKFSTCILPQIQVNVHNTLFIVISNILLAVISVWQLWISEFTLYSLTSKIFQWISLYVFLWSNISTLEMTIIPQYVVSYLMCFSCILLTEINNDNPSKLIMCMTCPSSVLWNPTLNPWIHYISMTIIYGNTQKKCVEDHPSLWNARDDAECEPNQFHICQEYLRCNMASDLWNCATSLILLT